MSWEWAQPLWFLALIPLLLRVLVATRDRTGDRFSFNFSDLGLIGPGKSITSRTAWLPFATQILGLGLLVVALARPQTVEVVGDERRGIDIAMVVDASGSMAAEDFRPDNRFGVAKRLIEQFIDMRADDRIGIVTFGTRAATRVPVTFDHHIARQVLREAEVGENGDGTAIGQAVATAVTRLRDSEAESRVIVLLTDGVNNSGSVDPDTAARVAAELGIRVYTIGVGSSGPVPVPIRVQDPFTGEITTRYQYIRADLDEEMLQRMAELSGGSYFRATDPETLAAVLMQIDELETTEMEAPKQRLVTDEYVRPLSAGLGLLTLAFIGSTLIWTRLPA